MPDFKVDEGARPLDARSRFSLKTPQCIFKITGTGGKKSIDGIQFINSENFAAF
ncbi:MAG: hypothetical protein VX496_05470 [Planctomycetota bacterium]|nr:hypothetical protein [Planctomycetota bacterium]